MLLPATGKVIVFDTEFTAWEGSWENGWSRPGEHREIIEIGAVLCDGPGLNEVAVFNVLVKPAVNPVLSDYIQDLTGITNDRLAREGMDLVPAMERFLAFAAGAGAVLSFGNDNEILADNHRLRSLQPPAALQRFRNAQTAICAAAGIDGRVSSCDLPERIGAALEGKAHSAVGDARAILHVLRVLRARGRL